MRIGNIWYNTDLTWNIENHLKYGVMPKFFLLSDKTFQDRCSTDERIFHCSHNESLVKCSRDMPLSMEELELCTKNLRNWESSNGQLMTKNEISIDQK